MDTKKYKIIVLHVGTKLALDKAKLVECETYDSVINRALKTLNSKGVLKQCTS